MSLEQNHSQFQENLKMLMVKSSLDDLQNIRSQNSRSKGRHLKDLLDER